MDSSNQSSVPSLFDLFIHPRRFFAHPNVFKGKLPLIAAIWLMGLARTLDRVDSRIAKAELTNDQNLWRVLEAIAGSWNVFWLFVTAISALSGWLIWLLWGWWFHRRVILCGATDAQRPISRRVFTYCSLVVGLPYLLLLVFWTLRYENYLAAYDQEMLGSILIVCLAFWELFTAYIAVRTVFSVDRWRARFWFIISPAIVYLIQLGLLVLIYTAAS